MNKFIAYQVDHFKNNQSFAQEIQQFETECDKIINTFNQEYLELMQEIHTDNLSEESIRKRNRQFADKWREYKFT